MKDNADPDAARAEVRNISVAMEKRYTKDQILERYLNIAYFGDGAYGIEAASRHYFGRSAATLTLPQAALLAGIVRYPYAYDPTVSPQRATERRNTASTRAMSSRAEKGFTT